MSSWGDFVQLCGDPPLGLGVRKMCSSDLLCVHVRVCVAGWGMHLQGPEEPCPVLAPSAYSLEIASLTEPGAHWCTESSQDPPFLEWPPHGVTI